MDFVFRFTICFTLAQNKNTFVNFFESCVKEIMKGDISFRYILPEQNPADIATRGSNAFEIAQSNLW